MTPSRFLPAIRPLLGAFFVLASFVAAAQPTQPAVIHGTTAGFGAWFFAGGATVGVAGSGSGVVTLGNQAQTNPSNLSGWSRAGNFGVSPAATGPTINNAADLPVGNGKSARVNVAQGLDKPSVGGAVARFATKVVFPLQVGIAAYDLLQELGYTNATRNPDGTLVATRPGTFPRYVNTSFCNGNEASGRWSNPPGEAMGGASDEAYWIRCLGYFGAQTQANYIRGTLSCNNTGALANRSCTYKTSTDPNNTQTMTLTYLGTSSGIVNLTMQQLADDIAVRSGWPSSSALPRAIRDALADGQSVSTTGTPTVSGPASVLGPKTVTNNPDGTRTEKQQVTNLTYNGPNIAISNTTTTNVYNTSNVVTSTTTETTTDAKPETDAPAADTDLPKQPELYKPKYPNGPAGVWDTEVAKIKATPLFALPSQLAPNLGDSGGCPNWTIPLNVGIQNWGTHSTNIPCSLWTFLRLCVIVGALFLARALIFGG